MTTAGERCRGALVHLPLSAPVPPLADPAAGVVLRPWHDDPVDVAALVAAWADPDLVDAAGRPGDAGATTAGRWIRAEAARRAAGACLDLVIAPLDGAHTAVLGEVGLRNVDRGRRRAEMGWWVAPERRGRGVAASAAALLVHWALSPAGGLDQVWARIDPANPGSARVAAAAGMARLGRAAGSDVWARAGRSPEDPRAPARLPT